MLPSEFWQYQNKPGRFFAYYGEVYYGTIRTHGGLDGFVVIPQYHLQKAQSARSSNDLIELGHHVSNPDTIVAHDDVLNDPNAIDNIASISSPSLDYKKLLVFGAGASSFCLTSAGMFQLENDKFRPPLGNEIFDKRFDNKLKHYPGAEALFPSIETSDGILEQVFQNEWNKIRARVDRIRLSNLISTQYYLHDLFRMISDHIHKDYKRNNLYSQLFQNLRDNLNEQEGVAVVTFNYDTLAEDAIQRCAGQGMSSISDYANTEALFCVFKPHGSANWGWKYTYEQYLTKTREELIAEIYRNRTDLFSIFYQAVGAPNMSIHKRSFAYEGMTNTKGIGIGTLNKELIEIVGLKDHYYPALLVPFAEKDEFLMPYSHATKLDQVLGSVEEIVCIGWKGSERAFNEKLNKHGHHLKKVTIVDPISAEVKSNLGFLAKKPKVEIEVHKTFEEFVRTLNSN